MLLCYTVTPCNSTFGQYQMTIPENIKPTVDIIITYAFGIILLLIVLRYTYQRMTEEGIGKGIYFGAWALFEAGAVFSIIYVLPLGVARLTKKPEIEVPLRWIILYIIVILIWWFVLRKYGGLRSLISGMVMLSVFLFGWLFSRWTGIVFISLPILGIFLFMLHKLAQVILPAANADNLISERWPKTRAFITYMLGLQYPYWAAKSKADREFEVRIEGSTFDKVGEPGILWTWSHQVAGVSTGINFVGVKGPGTVFINQYERPVALVDKRTQLRITTPETVTKDGIKIKTIVFTAFRIRHVRMALSRMGIDEALKEKGNNKLVFYWDEWVTKQVDDAARQVVAERELDQLWHPKKPGDSALDEMAGAMKDLLNPKMFNAGVEIFTARIVNFDLTENNKEDKKIIVQQLETWETNWKQKITQAEAEVTAIYREEMEKAHAYAKSALLETVAESLEKARRINDRLPRHVIAQYYIHALNEYIKRQPGLNAQDIKKRVENLRQVLLFSREGNE